jgi:hypothetical protein
VTDPVRDAYGQCAKQICCTRTGICVTHTYSLQPVLDARRSLERPHSHTSSGALAARRGPPLRRPTTCCSWSRSGTPAADAAHPDRGPSRGPSRAGATSAGCAELSGPGPARRAEPISRSSSAAGTSPDYSARCDTPQGHELERAHWRDSLSTLDPYLRI